MPSKNGTIKLLEEIADMLQFKGENKFKVRAYRAGADSLRKSNADFDTIVRQKELNKIKGIGPGLQKVIYEFFETNQSSLHKSLRDKIPAGIEKLLKIKGLNTKKINQLYNELGIKSLEELKKAAGDNLLVNVKGIGESLQNKILQGLQNYERFKNFILISAALRLSDEILSKLLNLKSVKKAERSGELRRGSEIVSELIFLILIQNRKNFLNELKDYFIFKEHPNKIELEGYTDIPVYFFLAENDFQYNQQLFLTTGSDEFILNLEMQKIKGSTEHEIFKSVNFPYVIPEMREKEFFQQKKALRKNSNLSLADLKGMLHVHTTYSDGKNTLKEMFDAADELGFKYASVNDHSRTAYYANGLDENRIYKQIKEIREYNSQTNLHLFTGTEVDILVNGDLDYNDELLSRFNFVIASVHSRFNLEEKEMTRRIIKAVENPYVDVLAHPSGRLLLSRAPYKIDMKKVIDACSRNDVAVEFNCSPRRLELEWRWIYYARGKGCLFSINTDAHSIYEFSYLNYGIMICRKAGVQPEEVINCFNLNKFKKFLNRKVKREF